MVSESLQNVDTCLDLSTLLELLKSGKDFWPLYKCKRRVLEDSTRLTKDIGSLCSSLSYTRTGLFMYLEHACISMQWNGKVLLFKAGSRETFNAAMVRRKARREEKRIGDMLALLPAQSSHWWDTSSNRIPCPLHCSWCQKLVIQRSTKKWAFCQPWGRRLSRS